MANSNFVVETGLQVGNLTIFAANGDIVTSGNVTYTGSAADTFDNVSVSGNIVYTNPATLTMSANSVQPKYYVDVMAVVFGT
jgi:hypothetical protein